MKGFRGLGRAVGLLGLRDFGASGRDGLYKVLGSKALGVLGHGFWVQS